MLDINFSGYTVCYTLSYCLKFKLCILSCYWPEEGSNSEPKYSQLFNFVMRFSQTLCIVVTLLHETYFEQERVCFKAPRMTEDWSSRQRTCMNPTYCSNYFQILMAYAAARKKEWILAYRNGDGCLASWNR